MSGVTQAGTGWLIRAATTGAGDCPGCGVRSTSPHGSYMRRLRDFPMQSAEASVDLIVTRWRCRNSACPRQTFSGCPAELASAFARRTRRVTRLARMLAYAAGGRRAERLSRNLGFPRAGARCCAR